MKSKLTLLLVLFVMQMNSQTKLSKVEIKLVEELAIKTKIIDSIKFEVDKLVSEKNQLTFEKELLKEELKEAHVPIEMTLSFLMQKSVLGNYMAIYYKSVEFYKNNVFAISFFSPQDTRVIDFRKLNSADDIMLSKDLSGIYFLIDNQWRLIYFPTEDGNQLLNTKLKNKVVKAFKHIKSLMEYNQNIDKETLFE